MESRLDWLLDLDGEIIVVDEAGLYFAKFDIRQVERSSARPHGIRYSLTLHEAATNERLIGFDNAHAVKQPRRGFRGRKVLEYDHQHRHRKDVGVAYDFSTPEQLVRDFWHAVDDYLGMVK